MREEEEMGRQPEIVRTVAIEHAGEKICIEVHVHLTPEEIEGLAGKVLTSLNRRFHQQSIIDRVGQELGRRMHVETLGIGNRGAR